MSWHRACHAFIRRLYFSRVSVIGAEHVPANGPLLALCLHRNGAVDAFVYRKVLPRLVYVVKAALRKRLFGRLFFDGIEVARAEDAPRRAGNLEALEECDALLAGGGRLGIFPEGTSKLGPRHLPFRSGAARIALRRVENGESLVVLPLGIHYECPWAFRSRVEVVVGPPVDLAPVAELKGRPARLLEIKRRFTAALEDVGVNFPDAKHQELALKFAYVATLGTSHSHFAALKAMEQRLPPGAVMAWERLERLAEGRRPIRHQGVPLFPLTGSAGYACGTLVLGLPVIAGLLANLPPLAVACWAGRTFSDDLNVIALWRILTGMPMFVLWAAAVLLAAAIAGPWWAAPAYLALTLTAVAGWYRLKKLAAVAWNGMFHSDLREAALAMHRCVLSELREAPQASSCATATRNTQTVNPTIA